MSKMLNINFTDYNQNYELRNSTQFPHDITIQDCRDAIMGAPGFRETTKNGITCFNYDFTTRQSFPDPSTAPNARTSFLYKVRRECRGILFEQSSGKLLCRKFHKFFNINELDETHQDKINLEGEKYVILEKLDGSLIAPIYTNDTVSWGSKSGATELSAKVEKYINSQADIKYNAFAEFWLKKGYTPMYEWCSESQRIVLYYANDLLSLTAIRCMKTGEYILYDEMAESAKQFNVPITGLVDQEKQFGPESKNATAAQLLESVVKMTHVEGYILRFNDGRVYKMKCTWYFEYSKSSSINLSHEKDIWLLILENKLDDTVSGLSQMGPLPKRYVHIQAFAKILFDRVETLAKTVVDTVYKMKKEHSNCRKVINNDQTMKPWFKKLLFEFIDQIDIEEEASGYMSSVCKYIVYLLKNQCGSASKLDQGRLLLDGLKYVESFD